MHQELAVPAARVSAARDLGVDLREERLDVKAGPDGRARLELDPGVWYLSASAEQPSLFGWYGSNPVQVRAGDTLDISIPGVQTPPPPGRARVLAGEESIAGQVAGEDGPIAQAGVALFLDAATLFRGPGYVEALTDDQGLFEARVSPGRYWLVARRRQNQGAVGPLEVGDDFGYYPGNPLAVHTGERVTVGIPAVRVLKKSGWTKSSTARARVAGTIRDAAGRPLLGYRAFLHAKPSMLGKPEFVSEPSGPDGAYVIWADREGVYYLGARAEIGQARAQGDAIGVFTGSPDHAVAVRPNDAELPALDIVVGGGGP